MSNVGVGVANPQFKMDIAGDLNFSGTLRSNGIAYIGSQWSNNAKNVFLLGSNVGLDVQTPQAVLDVAGSTLLRSNLNVSNVANFQSNVGIAGQLMVSNAAIFQSNVVISSNLNVSNNVNIYGKTSMLDSISFSSNISKSGIIYIGTAFSNIYPETNIPAATSTYTYNGITYTFTNQGGNGVNSAWIYDGLSTTWTFFDSLGSYNGVNGSYGGTADSTNGISGAFHQMQVSKGIFVTSYSLSAYAPNYYLKEWYVFGSIDGNIWVQLDFQTFSSWPYGSTFTTFNISNITSYTHYRFVITKAFVNAPSIREFKWNSVMPEISVISGTTSLSNNVNIYGVATLSNQANFQSNVGIAGILTVSNAAVFQSNVVISSNLNVSNAANFQSNLGIAGQLMVSNAAFFQSNVVISSNLNVSNTFSNLGNVYFASNLAVMSNIGVGVANPQFKMDVGGDLNFTGTLRYNGVPYIGSQWSNVTKNVFLLGSNVGLDTQTPQAVLDVAGSTLIRSNLNVSNVANFQSNVGIAGQLILSNAAFFQSNVVISSNLNVSNVANFQSNIGITGRIMVSNAAVFLSNIGINTSNSAYALDVAGDIQARSNLVLGSSLMLGNNTVNFRGIRIVKNSNINAPYNAVNNILTYIPGFSNTTNQTTVYNNFVVSSNLILNNMMQMRGLYVQKNSNVSATPYNVTSIINNITGFSNANNISTVYESNYVNIMVSNLEVTRFNSNSVYISRATVLSNILTLNSNITLGQLNTDTYIQTPGQLNLLANSTGNTSFINMSFCTGSNGNGNGGFYWYTGGGAYTGGAIKMVLLNNGNLGIGTGSPGCSLDVASTATTGQIAGFFTPALGNLQNCYITVGKTLAANGCAFINYSSNQYTAPSTQWGIYGGNYISLNSNGLGIGIGTPAYALDLTGDIRLTNSIYGSGPGLLCKSGTLASALNIKTDSSVFISAVIPSIFSSGDNSAVPGAAVNAKPLYLYGSNITYDSRFGPHVFTGGGYVGIGTVSPSAKLTVEGGTYSANTYPTSGHVCITASNSGGMGASLVLRNPCGTILNTAASIAFELDGSTAYDATGANAANGQISCIMENTNNGSGLAFSTWSGSSIGERMRLSAGGYLGIGTGNPNYGLHLSSTNVGAVQLFFSMSNQGVDGKHWGLGPNGNTFYGFMYNDALTTPVNWLQVARSGNSISSVSFPNGNVGIGTTTPTFPLHVTATNSVASASYTYAYIASSASSTFTPSFAAGPRTSYNAYFSSQVLIGELNIFSDQRIKQNIKYASSNTELELLQFLKPCEFNYIDVLEKGTNNKFGFIAQDVEKVLPNCVNKISDYIPNIFSTANIINNDNHIYTIKIPKTGLDLQINDSLKTCVDDKIEYITVSNIIENETDTYIAFERNQNENQIKDFFVIGKKVDDFRVIDYDYITSISVSAIQSLNNKVITLEDKIAKLTEQVEKLLFQK